MKISISILSVLILLSGCAKELEIPSYTLTVTANPPEGGLVNPQTGTYNSGETVNIVASANNFFAFSNWTGNWNGSENSFTITMDSNKTIIGNFEKIDIDEDGVLNDIDNCPNTSLGSDVDNNGCSLGQKDSDNDGITDDIDLCVYEGGDVDSNGCPDSDGDGIPNNIDQCISTWSGDNSEYITVDSIGCRVPIITYSTSDQTLVASNESEIGQYDVFLGSNYSYLPRSGIATGKLLKVVDKNELREILRVGEDPGFIPVTSKITDMSNLLNSLEITPYNRQVIYFMDVSNVTNMERMFYGSYFDDEFSYEGYSSSSFSISSSNWYFRKIFNTWNTANVTNMKGMFEQARLLDLDIKFNTSKVTNMTAMFAYFNMRKLSDYPIYENPSFNFIDFRFCTYLDSRISNNTFYGICPYFNARELNLIDWDVSSVETFDAMFAVYVHKYSGIENWNVSSSINMRNMFIGGRIQYDLSSWDVSNVSLCKDFASDAEIGTGIINYNSEKFKVYFGDQTINIPLDLQINNQTTLNVSDYFDISIPNFTNCNPD